MNGTKRSATVSRGSSEFRGEPHKVRSAAHNFMPAQEGHTVADPQVTRGVSAATQPRVSVLLPVRNGMPWLPAAIDSVLAQTFTAFELIVLEDGSTDDTLAFLSGLDDPRLRIAATGGVGIALALNIGIDAARGAYVARQDADDESLPDRLARQVEFLDGHADVDILATSADYIDAAGNVVSSPWVDTVRRQQDVAVTHDDIRALMPLTCCVTHGSIMMRRAVLGADRYDAAMVPAEDYDLWLRLLPRHRFAKLPARLYRHRLHGSQSGALRRGEQTRKAILAKLRYVRRVRPGLPTTATLAVVGGTRGDRFYRDIAPQVGFRVVDGTDSWDVLTVTDFTALDAVSRELSTSRGITRIGNCFVTDRRASSRRALRGSASRAGVTRSA